MNKSKTEKKKKSLDASVSFWRLYFSTRAKFQSEGGTILVLIVMEAPSLRPHLAH